MAPKVAPAQAPAEAQRSTAHDGAHLQREHIQQQERQAAPTARPLTPERVQRFIDDIRAAKAEAQQCVPLARGVAAFPLRASLFAARLEILLQTLVGELAGADAAQQVQNAIDAPWTDFDAAEFLRGLAGSTLFNLDAQVH